MMMMVNVLVVMKLGLGVKCVSPVNVLRQMCHCCSSDITTPFPLHELDFRFPYHFRPGEKALETEDKSQYDDCNHYIVWFELDCSKIDDVKKFIDLVNSYVDYENYAPVTHLSDGTIVYQGICDGVSKVDGSGFETRRLNYDEETLTICSSCHRWFCKLHPEYIGICSLKG